MGHRRLPLCRVLRADRPVVSPILLVVGTLPRGVRPGPTAITEFRHVTALSVPPTGFDASFGARSPRSIQ